jgi:uncharacterized protein (TIGR03000 family)
VGHGGYHPGHGGGFYHSGYHSGLNYGGYRGFGLGYPYSGGFGAPYLSRGLNFGLGYGYGSGGLGYGYGLGGYGFGLNAPGYGYNVGGYGYIPYRVSAPPYRVGSGYYRTIPAAPAVVGYPAIVGQNAAPASPNLGGTVSVPKEPTPATVTVLVPEGAELSFDGKETEKADGSRVYTSPPLEPGKTVNLAIKTRANGSAREMQLPIRAGDKITVDFRGQ